MRCLRFSRSLIVCFLWRKRSQQQIMMIASVTTFGFTQHSDIRGRFTFATHQCALCTPFICIRTILTISRPFQPVISTWHCLSHSAVFNFSAHRHFSTFDRKYLCKVKDYWLAVTAKRNQTTIVHVVTRRYLMGGYSIHIGTHHLRGSTSNVWHKCWCLEQIIRLSKWTLTHSHSTKLIGEWCVNHELCHCQMRWWCACAIIIILLFLNRYWLIKSLAKTS